MEITTPDVRSPQADFVMSSPTSSQEHQSFEVWDNLELTQGAWDAPAFSNDLWPSSSSAEAVVAVSDFHPSTTELRPGPVLRFPSFRSSHVAQVSQGADIAEKEIELVMLFVGETFALQHPSYRVGSAMRMSWLLFLLMRSTTFYYASLGISAYHYSLTLSGDSEARGVAFQNYLKYRACALRGFCELLDSDWPTASLSDSQGLLGERMICGVQIALLEVRMIYHPALLYL